MIFQNVGFDQQLSRATEIFHFARANSRFYSEKFKDIDDIRGYEDWLNIPFLTRQDIYQNAFPHSTDMLTCELKDMMVVSTGGTSGIARFGVVTYAEWHAFATVQANALRVLGVTNRDIVANLFVAGYLWPSFLGGHEIIKDIGAVHLPISAITDIDKLIYFFDLFQPTVILSVPSLLIYFSDELIKRDRTYPTVSMIQFAGEHLSENAARLVRHSFPHARIKAAGYTSADCGLMGYQCENCGPTEYHVPTDFQLIEIYDFENERVSQRGELGEVVVTNLQRRSFPIIRYRLGDVGYFKPEACTCGDKNPILVLKGRAGDDFKFGSGYIGMEEIERCFSHLVSKHGISANYQVEIDNLENGKTSFILRIESSDMEESVRYRDVIRDTLLRTFPIFKQALDADFMQVFRVDFVDLGGLARSPITGKVKRLIDKRVGS